MISIEPILDYVGNFLLFLLVFGMSATVNITQVQKQVKNRKAILSCTFLQFIILPFLGFITVKLLKMDKVNGIMLLVITSSPGGSYSNWWCSLFNADLALSVTMTAISTIVSMVIMPLNLLLYSKFTFEAHVVESLDWTSLFISLIVVTMAICLGLTCSAYAHSFAFNVIANKLGNYSGLTLVLFSIFMSNSSSESSLWDRPWYFYAGVAMPCVLALIIGNIITSVLLLPKPERVTISVETCYQNIGIATSVALTMFDGNDSSKAMCVPVYYGMLEAVILGMYCLGAWKLGWTKAPPSDPICTVISTSYEVLETKNELREIEISLSDSNMEQASPDESKIHYYVCFDDQYKGGFPIDALCGNLCNTVLDDEIQTVVTAASSTASPSKSPVKKTTASSV